MLTRNLENYIYVVSKIPHARLVRFNHRKHLLIMFI